MGHMERAWAALMAGNMDQVMVETQYIDGPNRLLGGIASLVRDQYGDAAGEWLDVSNVKMGGLSPRRFLKLDDMSTWYVVWHMLCQRIDISDIDYPAKSDPTDGPS